MSKLSKREISLTEYFCKLMVGDFMQRNGVSREDRQYFSNYIASQIDYQSSTSGLESSSKLAAPSCKYKLLIDSMIGHARRI